MNPQENFNCDYFSDLIDYIMLSSSGEVKLHTKVGTEITEGENEPLFPDTAPDQRHCGGISLPE